MKASISTWSFPGAMPLEQKLNLARAAGFEGFELDFTEDGPVKLDSTPADLRAVRKLLDDHGLVPSGLATGLYWGANPASADPAVRARAARILERQRDLCLSLDAMSVRQSELVAADDTPGDLRSRAEILLTVVVGRIGPAEDAEKEGSGS
mgnify:CR=1 FL=1